VSSKRASQRAVQVSPPRPPGRAKQSLKNLNQVGTTSKVGPT